MDARHDYLHVCGYDGSGRSLVYKGSAVTHPFAMSVFEDYVYYTDWTPGSVNRIRYGPSFCLLPIHYLTHSLFL